MKSNKKYTKARPNKVEYQEPQEYVIFGLNPVFVAIKANKRKIDKIFITQEAWQKLSKKLADSEQFNLLKPFMEVCHKDRIDYMMDGLQRHLMNKVHNHQGILAVFEPRYLKADLAKLESLARNQKCIIMLDEVSDIGNIASIARSMVCFGTNIMVYKKNNMPDLVNNPDVARLSSGASELLEFFPIFNVSQFAQKMVELGFAIVGFDSNAKLGIDDLKADHNIGKYAIVLGSEGRGLSPEVKKICTHFVKIPLSQIAIDNGVDSLNVSIACAVGLSQFTAS